MVWSRAAPCREDLLPLVPASLRQRFKGRTWWFRKWADPLGEHAATSGVDNSKRPYPIDGTWERYSFKVGNIRFLMMSDRNDLPYPVGRKADGGASPAGAVTSETFEWWKNQVEFLAGRHHHVLRASHAAGNDGRVRRLRRRRQESGRHLPIMADITARTGRLKELPISISWVTSRRHKPLKTTWPRIPARSTSGRRPAVRRMG